TPTPVRNIYLIFHCPVAREDWGHPTRASRGYNRGHSCLLLRARTLAPMKSWHRWARAGWEQSAAPAMRASDAMWPSRFCRRPSLLILTDCGDLNRKHVLLAL